MASQSGGQRPVRLDGQSIERRIARDIVANAAAGYSPRRQRNEGERARSRFAEEAIPSEQTLETSVPPRVLTRSPFDSAFKPRFPAVSQTMFFRDTFVRYCILPTIQPLVTLSLSLSFTVTLMA